MKKILRKIPIFLTVFVFVLSCVLFPVSGASAYEMNTVYLQPDVLFDGYRAYVYTDVGLALRSSSPTIVYFAQYHLSLDLLNEIVNSLNGYASFKSLSSSYKVSDDFDDPAYPDNGYLIPVIVDVSVNGVSERHVPALSYLDTYEEFYDFTFSETGLIPVARYALENGGSVSISYQSLTPDPGIYLYSENVPPEPLYNSAWDLFVKYIYGEDAVLTPDQTLTLTLLATLSVILIVAFPFGLVFFVLKLVFRW